MLRRLLLLGMGVRLLRCNRLRRLLWWKCTTCDVRVVLRFWRWYGWYRWLSWGNLLGFHRCRSCRWWTYRRCLFGTSFGGASRCRGSFRCFSCSFVAVVLERRRWNLGLSFHQVRFVNYLLPEGRDFVLDGDRGRRRNWLFTGRNIWLSRRRLLEHFTRAMCLRGQRIRGLDHREL